MNGIYTIPDTRSVWFTLIRRIAKMDAKIESMSSTMVDQQKRIEDLTGRVIRLETALEIALNAQGRKPEIMSDK